ncbi:transposase [Mycoplana sp. BE70]|uniref:hypothetical protein n=1 Tax=Mycoplana sp. BE70 TaxID=2817775 RepID=UPI002859CF34|nr:hypothetical protein [Mycoplana sp. BE70]MDR6758564.1 transposase [Mycoplana sp. BE70]
MQTASSGTPAQMPASRLDDDIRLLVAGCVSTLLLCHEYACRCRPCRRARGCVMVGRDGQPGCLRAAAPDLLALHRALLAETLRLLETIAFAPSTPVEPPSRDPDDRELQDAAMDLVQALLPRQGNLRNRFSTRRRQRDAVARPPFAGRDLAQYRDLLRLMRAKRIAPALNGGLPASLPRPPGRRAGVLGGLPLAGWPVAGVAPYSAAALAAAASSTAANAAAITSGPAPGLVASADRICR